MVKPCVSFLIDMGAIAFSFFCLQSPKPALENDFSRLHPKFWRKKNVDGVDVVVLGWCGGVNRS
ncbi:MAG: hypothetical protein RMY28_037315 [Nostoc sp. ChiSLP01]|nr:hypothetical protein [Nostoc sp. CmiSLP01]MDZ8287364.1 hypothetical protein [Nostoc sp. ChiSLP01]